MSMPLEGFRVLEWGLWIAAPTTSMMLGDLGADVIKIEHRVTGDPCRGLDAGYGTGTGRQSLYEGFNRNKRSLTLDLGKPEALEVVYRLVETSDVFVTNFRQSVAKRTGLDYETLSKKNPELIYTVITGYGSKGPEADIRAFDGLAQGRSALAMQAHPDGPVWIRPALGDTIAGINSAFGIVTALLARERGGTGQKVETSLLSSLMFQQTSNIALHFIGFIPYAPTPRTKPTNPLLNMYLCGDNKWINIYIPEADRFWPSFCKAMGIEHLRDDPKFKDIWIRAQNSEELVSILDPIFASKPRHEWIRILQENECVIDVINDYPDLPNDEQVIANNYLPEFDHPNYGKIVYSPIPVEFGSTPGQIRMPAPEFGQHTEEILLDAGYSWEEIVQFKEKEVI
ncbi:MAG: CoA transferase [Dehalococcoidia bacterium]